MIHAVFIDNDQSSQVLFEEICRQHNFQYTGIQRSERAVQSLSQISDIDIILLDLQMPKHNGYEVLKLLRMLSDFQSIPIVACTVYADEIERARHAGFSSFIVKPLQVDSFPEQLLAILKGQSIWETHSS
jgi:CheY-like chemotaxis protein